MIYHADTKEEVEVVRLTKSSIIELQNLIESEYIDTLFDKERKCLSVKIKDGLIAYEFDFIVKFKEGRILVYNPVDFSFVFKVLPEGKEI